MSVTQRTVLGALLVLLTTGCNPDVQNGVGPIVPVPDVGGLVLRAGDGADDLEVDLRTAATSTVVSTTSTDGGGSYWFVEVSAGEWEVKVSSDESEDFSAVSREFSMATDDVQIMVQPMDIARHGADLLLPADGDTLSTPNPFVWLEFSWRLPETGIDWARVQVYDRDGTGVWFSDKEAVELETWNGLGNQGDYDGQRVTAGSYRWRVKFGFPDGMEARLDSRELTLE